MNINQFAAKLQSSGTIKQTEKILADYLSQFGFKYYAVTYYSGHIKSGRKLRYDFVSPALLVWHKYYLEQAFADSDRTLQENHTRVLPLFWDVQQQLLQAKNPREKLIREESINFGINKGLSIPVHGPNNDFLCWTLHQCQHEKSLVNYEEKQYEWMSAAQVYYHYLSALLDANNPETVTYHLSKREQQCLALTAKSWRVEQIAKELNITPRTVNFHLQNVNKKMGTHNKYYALMKYLENN